MRSPTPRQPSAAETQTAQGTATRLQKGERLVLLEPNLNSASSGVLREAGGSLFRLH